MPDLFDALCWRANREGDRLAFDDGDTRLAYAPLARRVAGAAEELCAITNSPSVIGLLGGNRCEWIIGQLAAWSSGRTVVPLPSFFSRPQLRHVICDAGVTHLIASPDMSSIAASLGLPVIEISRREGEIGKPQASRAAQITYTSGSTGQPKGVLSRLDQLEWTGGALAEAIDACATDHYLSVLPLALLLETICAILVPVLAGASVSLAPALTDRFGLRDGAALAASVARARPSCMVLVPQLLLDWTEAVKAGGEPPPDCLRFVAVGGAPVPDALARDAWQLGMPVYEGYGLTECGSVVALNRPGKRVPGTVGMPLPGHDVRVEDGEIIVRGPSVMAGYLHGEAACGEWRTGDLGSMGADGSLVLHGRRDNLIVTALGRNVSPEWIETLLMADPRIANCVVAGSRGNDLTAILVPARNDKWFASASAGDIRSLAAKRCRGVPDFAIPRNFIVVPQSELLTRELITWNGRICRPAIMQAYATALEFTSGVLSLLPAVEHAK